MTTPTREDEIREMAREIIGGDSWNLMRVDPDASIRDSGKNGCYVPAWVFVPFAGTKFDKEKKP